MSTVYTNTFHLALKKTLDRIADDKTDERKLILNKFCEMRPMTDAYHDDLETGGPGLVAEVDEGDELPVGTIREGYLKRYRARKYGMRIIVTEEAMEDAKYPETINAGKRLLRAIYKTADIDGTLMLVRAFNPAYVGGDNVQMISDSHTLPHGGTFSNAFAVPMSPSRSSVIVARTQAMLLPGHDGITEGFDLKRVIFPVAQWGVWEGIVKSEKAPENDSNEINVVKGLDLELCPNKYWSNTTTNYIFQTDAPNGLTWRWRRKPRSRTWMTNEHELEQFAISARWDRGWTDARGMIGVEA